ncbi:Cupin 1 [Dillenia turbinata]|uniref:Cupin 1 n=1 Tax=Dillenia turbinata TaxID=194707 RepID=A0AAN8VKL0_9MAGN
MGISLTPMQGEKVFEGGGCVYLWSPSKFLIHSECNLGGAIIQLCKYGFAFPHFTDCPSFAYILRALDLPKPIIETIKKHQTGLQIIKLREDFQMPKVNNEFRKDLVFNFEEAEPDLEVENGGKMVILNCKRFPSLGELGISGMRTGIEGGAILAPCHFEKGAAEVAYIMKGGGKVQCLGNDGKLILDGRLKAGNLIALPNPELSPFIGKNSVWMALSPEVLQASFSITPQIEQTLAEKQKDKELLIPPTK